MNGIYFFEVISFKFVAVPDFKAEPLTEGCGAVALRRYGNVAARISLISICTLNTIEGISVGNSGQEGSEITQKSYIVEAIGTR